MKAFLFVSRGMAAIFDFTVGILVVAVVAHFLSVEPLWWWYVLGSFLAVLPDMDLMPMILTGRNVAFNHHETIMHRPVVIIPIATATAALLGGTFFALVALICVTWHYLHDMREFGGGGIAWAWPYSRLYLSFLGNEQPEDAKMNFETENYLEWLNPTPLSVREFILATILLIVSSQLIFGSIWIGIGVGACLWLGAGAVWGAWSLFRSR